MGIPFIEPVAAWTSSAPSERRRHSGDAQAISVFQDGTGEATPGDWSTHRKAAGSQKKLRVSTLGSQGIKRARASSKTRIRSYALYPEHQGLRHYCWYTSRGPLTCFVFRSTVTSTRSATLMNGIPLSIP